MGWEQRFRRERERYEDGIRRLAPGQLLRLGNAAYGAGLCLLMLGRPGEAREWLGRAGSRWRESWEHAPPGSWGRPVGMLKAALIAADEDAVRDAARAVLDAGAAGAESPIGRYAAAVACLVLDRGGEALVQAGTLRGVDDFPNDVAEALVALAANERDGYAAALESVLVSFESRDRHLEGVPVADTVLALNDLAARRNLRVEVRPSPVLPAVS